MNFLKRTRLAVATSVRFLLSCFVCQHDTLIQRRVNGEMRLTCWHCGKHWPAGFERSALAKRLDRQQRRAQARRESREVNKPTVVRRVA